jgi:hypothetical protein|tara:strand:+ start:676 stop:1137 length:462 start_codon:yes stop_codon:yes gene_type:complete
MATKTLTQLKSGRDFGDVLDSIKNNKVFRSDAHSVQTAGALTVTIAMILEGFVVMDPTADRAFTLTTAALAVAGVTGVAVGDSIDFSIINTGTGSEDEIVTLAAGTGGTLVGSGAVLTSNPVDDAFSSGSGLFRLRFTNVTAGAEAITCYRLA